MSRLDRLALLISLCGACAAYLFGWQVFENMPHLEDEFTYAWQAQAIAGGAAILPSPPCPECFTVPFVVDHQGQRFGKYPLGFPVVLALGYRLNAHELVNPVLAGVCLWLMYLLVKKVQDEPTALLASGLTLVSPFFLINSSNLLSHTWSLLLSVSLALAWLDTFTTAPHHPRLTACVAALCLGGLALTRPLTALGVGVPFGLHALYLLLKGSSIERKRVAWIGLAASLIASIHFLWQFSLTGDALVNPYTLWWPRDTIGFGAGVGYQQGGYHLGDAFVNLAANMSAGASDLFGWPGLSWIFIPAGIIAIRRKPRALLLSAVFLSLVLAYFLYWSAAWIYGPRYYYEALFSLTLLSAAGIRWLALKTGNRWCLWITTGLVLILISVNLFIYLPQRAASLTGLYGISRSDLEPFLTPQAIALTPALVFVHTGQWNDYHPLLELGNPDLSGAYLVVFSLGEEVDDRLALQYPERSVIHYYPDEPGQFYFSPRK